MIIQGIRFESAPAAYVTKSPSFKGSKKVSLPDAEKMKSATLQLGATALAAIASANIIKSNKKPIPVEKLDYSSFDKIEGELTNNGKSKVVKNNDGIIIREYGKGRNGKVKFVKDYDKNGNVIKYSVCKYNNRIFSDCFNKKGVRTESTIFSRSDNTLISSKYRANGTLSEKTLYYNGGKSPLYSENYDEYGNVLKKIIYYPAKLEKSGYDLYYVDAGKFVAEVNDDRTLVKNTEYDGDGNITQLWYTDMEGNVVENSTKVMN